MPIITLSFGAAGIRDNIARNVADRLGYECVGRQVIQEASERFDVPEVKLSRAMRDIPSLFGMSVTTRSRYLAYVLAAAARYLLKDNLVYHGPAAHVIGQGISHVIKVRIIPHREARIAFEMENNGISREKALEVIEKEEKKRRKYMTMAFGIDDTSDNIYDLIIDRSVMNSSQAAEEIAVTASQKKYQPMSYSIQTAKNIELSYRVKAQLVELDPEIQVRCQSGNVHLQVKCSDRDRERKERLVQERMQEIEDVESIEIQILEDPLDRIAGTMR